MVKSETGSSILPLLRMHSANRPQSALKIAFCDCDSHLLDIAVFHIEKQSTPGLAPDGVGTINITTILSEEKMLALVQSYYNLAQTQSLCCSVVSAAA